MLTKNLISYRVRSGSVIPSYLRQDSETLGVIARLQEVMASSVGESFEDLQTQLVTESSRKPKVSQGLAELLLGQCQFEAVDENLPSIRRKLLIAADRVRRNLASEQNGNGDELTLRGYQHKVQSTVSDYENELLRIGLYRDHPDRRLLVAFDSPSKEDLIDRFNLAQVQGLLMDAKQLDVTTKGASKELMRAFVRAVKFHRLLIELVSDPSSDPLVMRITGPQALFGQVKQYGMRLATFFPYVLQLPNWRAEVTIESTNRGTLKLVLPRKNQAYRSTYRSLTSYIPAEFSDLIEAFNRRDHGKWLAQTGSDFLNLGHKNYVFPDITLLGPGGKKLHVELFHKWHKGQLHHRLSALNNAKTSNLYLGIEKTLMKDKNISAELMSLTEKGRKFLTFSDVPTPRQLATLLTS